MMRVTCKVCSSLCAKSVPCLFDDFHYESSTFFFNSLLKQEVNIITTAQHKQAAPAPAFNR